MLKHTLAVGLLLVALASTPAVAQSPVAAPSWLSRPEAQDLERVYPANAFRVGMGGTAKLNCKVAGDGRLEGCKVVDEKPSGRGFGEAALKLAPLFRMDPATRGATTVITLPIRFGVAPSPEVLAAIKTCVPDGSDAPHWARRPTGADIASVFPERAARLEKQGTVRIGCVATADGAMIDCRVVEEEPGGMGFGEAALKLMPVFRMAPLTSNCESVAGATVTIPINFSLR